jgi:hypothetical protein
VINCQVSSFCLVLMYLIKIHFFCVKYTKLKMCRDV